MFCIYRAFPWVCRTTPGEGYRWGPTTPTTSTASTTISTLPTIPSCQRSPAQWLLSSSSMLRQALACPTGDPRSPPIRGSPWNVGKLVSLYSANLFVCLSVCNWVSWDSANQFVCLSVGSWASWHVANLFVCFFWQVGKLTPYLYLFVVNTSRLPTLSAAHSSCSAYGLVDRTLR